MRKETFFVYTVLFALLASAPALAQDTDARFSNARARCEQAYYAPFPDIGKEPAEELCACLEGKMRELNLTPDEDSTLDEVFGPADTNATPEAYTRCMQPYFKSIGLMQQQQKMESGGEDGAIPEPPGQ